MISSKIYCNSRQQGAALVTALMFLIILTMIALNSMTTNTLEERMASNSQEINRSFQAAERGLILMRNDADAMTDTSGTTTPTTDANFGIDNNINLVYSTTYQQQTKTRRGSSPSDPSNAYQHFDYTSTATAGGVVTVLHAGAYREGPSIKNY